MIGRDDVILPMMATEGSMGYDFFAPHDFVIRWDCPTFIDTGVSFEEGDIKKGFGMFLAPRSSLGVKYGLRFTNTLPVIDSDYRDTVKVSLECSRLNMGESLEIRKGERFMQGIILAHGYIDSAIPPVSKRFGGFGSTGL